MILGTSQSGSTKEERQEAKFEHARRSLRLWPIVGEGEGGLHDFLLNKLRLDRDFVQDMGETTIKRTREPKNKNKNECIVTFESKQVRDAVKAAAPNLANHRENAGMRLHIPDHLQGDFHALMNLSFDLKKKHTGLKRNVKFDEVDNGLFMDFSLDGNGDWRRVKPAQARKANGGRRTAGARDTDEAELQSLLGDAEEEEVDE